MTEDVDGAGNRLRSRTTAGLLLVVVAVVLAGWALKATYAVTMPVTL